MRVRGFTQDDAHIFCTEEQVIAECALFLQMLNEVYQDFGFNDIIFKLSTRPEKRHGSDEDWDISEKALANALNTAGIEWQENPGEGAFYGPKIEFSMKDCLGRVWQMGTLQYDRVLPERLGAVYIDEQGKKVRPVMLHRAIFGSLERFIGILLEHYADGLPVWLAPVQAVIMNITDRQADYAAEIAKNLQKDGFRVDLDLRNEKIGYKIREHSIARVPYLLVVGDRELENSTVSVRTHGGQDLGSLPVAELSAFFKTAVDARKTVNNEE
jgi:threonyl-tRNA synthetase